MLLLFESLVCTIRPSVVPVSPSHHKPPTHMQGMVQLQARPAAGSCRCLRPRSRCLTPQALHIKGPSLLCSQQPWPAWSPSHLPGTRHPNQHGRFTCSAGKQPDTGQLQTANSVDPTNSSSSSDGGGVNRLLVLGGLVAAAAAILVASGGLGGLKDRVHDLEDLIAASGYLGPLIYAAAYTTSTVLLFPASVLTLAAGFLFGPLKGTAVVSASSTAGACLAFLVSRYLARPLVESKVAGACRTAVMAAGGLPGWQLFTNEKRRIHPAWQQCVWPPSLPAA